LAVFIRKKNTLVASPAATQYFNHQIGTHLKIVGFDERLAKTPSIFGIKGH